MTLKNQSSFSVHEPIAIIGMGCRFPGNANNVDEFWEKVLVVGKDAVGAVPKDRWDADALYHPDYTLAGKISVKTGGFIDDIDKFDPQFFGISPREALRVDPQQRILLETAYQAMEDAGMPLHEWAGKNVGVFVGISSHDYGDIAMHPSEHVHINGHTISGGAASIASNRISYVFDFRGPSFSVDTACSSSLIALHNACRSIWNKECVVALVGGANALIKPEISMSFSKGGFLSPDGRCFTFDKRANGYIRSEGIGVVVLKPLSEAVANGDKIYATVIGTALNQDGATDGLSMPNESAQVEVITEAYKRAGIDPATVQYVETHGTGTAVGDPIETNSIGRVIGVKKKSGDKIIIGSVKSNIGHLEPASGMAGLVKLALSMKHRKIPQNVHFKDPNPKIKFEEYNLHVPTEMEPWPVVDGDAMVAGINSFGFGGANCHAVLQGVAVDDIRPSVDDDQEKLFIISAKNQTSLKNLAEKYLGFLEKNRNNADVSLTDICHSAKTRRTRHDQRLAVVAHDKETLSEKLRAYLNDETRVGMSTGRIVYNEENPAKVVFVYSGQGPQWYAMGRELIGANPIFKTVVTEIDGYLSALGWGTSLLTELSKNETESRIHETEIAQPAIFAVQVGLTEIWKSQGVLPDAIVGHSVGEVAAAYAAGAVSLKEATRIIFCRSRNQSFAAGKGKMLAVGISLAEAQKRIEPYKDIVSAAVINGPKMLTLSGDTAVLEKLAELFNSEDIFNRFLKVDIPFHSHYLAEIKDGFINSLGEIECRETTTPLYSTVTGAEIDGRTLNADYWYANIRQSVLFYPAVKALIGANFNTFIEIAPHPILAASINDTFTEQQKRGTVVYSLRRNEGEMRQLLGQLGALHTAGYEIDWQKSSQGKFIDLPFYPFVRERFWLESEASIQQRLGSKIHPHITEHTVSARSQNDHTWNIELDKRLSPYIDDHRVQGPIIFPGAGSCELSFACGKNAFGDDFQFIEDIYFKKAVFLPDEGAPPEIQFNLSADDGSFGIYSRKSAEDNWTRHIHGKLRHLGEKFELPKVSLAYAQERCQIPVDMEPLYDELYAAGLMLGPTFRSITNCRRYASKPGERYIGESLGEIVTPEAIVPGVEQYNIHPAILDACFQALFGSVPLKENERLGVCVPVHIEKLRFYRQPSKKLYCYGRLKERSYWYIEGELRIYDDAGNLCLDIDGFRCRFIEGTRGEDAANLDRCIYKYEWKIQERKADALVRNPAEYLVSPLSISKKTDAVIREIQRRKERELYDAEFEPKLNTLTADYIVKALEKLGFKFEIGLVTTTDALIETLGIVPGYLPKLFQRTLEILAEYGILKQTAARHWKVVKVPAVRDLNSEYDVLKAAEAYGPFKHELIMLGKCGPFLKEVFTGRVDPVELLFPDEEWAATVAFYQESYSFKKYNEIVRPAIRELLKKLPENQTLRILEIGAGTGGMTSAVLPELPADRSSYTYTDLSYMFMVKAEERFGAKYPFLDFKVVDIGKDLAAQGIAPHSYDMVIASDVLHATPNVKETLANIKKLLAPNGVVTILEVTQCPWWTDLVFGLTEGWWVFEDHALRPKHPTMSKAKWEKALASAGFYDILAMTEAVDPGVSAQTVFMARNNDFKQERISVALPKRDHRKWLIFEDSKGVAASLSKSLQASGQECFEVSVADSFSAKGRRLTMNPCNPEDMTRVFDVVTADKTPLCGIIHCWNLDHPPTDQMTCQSLEESYKSGDTCILDMLRELFRDTDDHPPHFWIVTGGAMNVGDVKNLSVSQSSVWGMARTIMHEYAHLDTTLIDISANPSALEIGSLTAEIFEEEQAEEVALRGKSRYLHRYVRATVSDEVRRAMRPASKMKNPFHLITRGQGILENLMLQETTRKLPGPGEIEIEVKAAALNFKDVMIATGLLPEDAPKGGYTGKALGMECSGIVTAVGKGVKGMRKGDAVMAIAADAVGTYAVTDARFATKLPSKMNFEEAAALPFAYLTAYYALHYLARMAPGERVLIHAASGGVGLAGVKAAMHVGAEVYATAGSPEKRRFLKKLGVKHVFDSRRLDFAEEIMSLTNGEGVDIVLNSLSGSAIYKSMSVLRKYGRFVEIGKTDIYENRPLGLRPFWNNLSYHAVDIDKLLTERPALCGELLGQIADLFKGRNKLLPHPIHSFPVSKTADAFRLMAAAKHIGKVVITMDDQHTLVNPTDDLADIVLEKATYVVTGGWSGLGLTCVKFLVEKGARHLVVIGRSGATSKEAKQVLAQLRKQQITVMEAKVDAGDENAMAALFRQIKKEKMPPIHGVINSAMVLDDAILPDMTAARFMTAIRPKVMGVVNLHNNTLKEPIDFFTSFSSVSGQYGTPAQCNYAAANLFLDMFSYYRQAHGLPGNTLSWGVISEVGFVARNQKTNDILASQGWKSFDPRQAMSILEKMILQGHALRSAMDVNWPDIAQYFPKDKHSHRFSTLLSEDGRDGGDNGGDSLRDQILAMDAAGRTRTMEQNLAEAVARILGTSADKLDHAEPISNMGLDSLMANQLRNWIQVKLEIEYSMMKIMRGPNIAELSRQLLEELTEGAASKDVVAREPSAEINKWFVRKNTNAETKIRLFCLPYMAGGATSFTPWNEALPAEIELLAVQYPGREDRADEKAFDRIEALVAKTAEMMLPLLDKPFALYGHSIGTAVAYALAHHLIEKYHKTPVCLFAGGWIAPKLKSPFTIIEDVTEQQIEDDAGRDMIMAHLKNLGIPDTVLANRSLIDEMMPGIKADMLMGKRMQLDKMKPVACPLVAIAGKDDHVFTPEQVKAWEQHTTASFVFEMVSGGHLFMRESRDELIAIIRRVLEA